jgi:4-alpha-glucanotransferase
VTARPALRALAERAGILPSYVGLHDRKTHETSDETREALLAAMGFAADGETAAARTLSELEEREAARLIPSVAVVREGEPRRLDVCVAGSAAPAGAAKSGRRRRGPGMLRWEAALHGEDGEVRELGGRATVEGDTASVRLPAVGLGVHRLVLRIDDGDGTRETTQLRCVGNLSDLADLVRFTAEAGGDFVGVNPLHALRNRSPEVSPYGPVSRLFRNPIYVDPWAVPELAASLEAQVLLESSEMQRELAALRSSARVEYARVQALLAPLLRVMHRTLVETGRQHDDHPRMCDFTAYKEKAGALLRDFATFAALEEHFAEQGIPRDWRCWPAAYRDPSSTEVAEFRARHATEVDFHAFVQFELDRQLAEASAAARTQGLAVGIYQDLAVGTLASGFDPWAFPGLFVDGATLGAPPDDYAAMGQDWGLPPVDPRRLADGGYGYWRSMLASSFAHSGALRLDHVMGMLRQYWVPAGRPATEGAYVAFPWRDLAGLVALESRRHRALVIGEDLGTVPDGFRTLMSQAGMLSSRVLLFSRRRSGTFQPASEYPERALVTANTHDHPTLAAWWAGRDIDLRESIGVFDDAAAEHARQERKGDRRALAARLATDGLLPAREREAPSATALGRAVTAFLAGTPCRLLGVSLDDLAAETEPVNVPGVGVDRYPSWSRRMHATLAELREDADAKRLLAATGARRHRRRRRA